MRARSLGCGSWTSATSTRTVSPGSPPAPCRWRSRTRRPTPSGSLSRPGAATTMGSRSHSSPNSPSPGMPSMTCSSRTCCSTPSGRHRNDPGRLPGPAAGARRRRPAAARQPALQLWGHRPSGGDPPGSHPSFLPNYREFYEKRYFADGVDQRDAWWRPEVPFGPDLIVDVEDVPGLSIHVEVCEDMWVPVPPSHKAALAGATVLLNLSASPITVGRAEDRHLLARAAAAGATRHTRMPPRAQLSRRRICPGTA